MRSLVSFFIGIFLASSLRAEEKFSLATTPGKLPRDIIPRAYAIHLEPNTDSLVTVGSESIEVEVLKPTDRIVINVVDTEILQATLSGSHSSEELTPQIDPKAETVTFQTKTSLQPGSYQLSLTFQSKITEQPHGLFIQYFRVGDRLERLLATEMGFGGAMENWGGITYNEDLLLFDPHASSDLAKQHIFEVMAHEIAHQWFGDLVTMAWWDNIWLNEGFASWMEKKATDHFNPDWKIWVHANNDKQRAMAFDARKTSHPIQQPIADEAQANSAFDEIAKQNLPAQGQREADNAANLIRYRADLKKSELPNIDQWVATKIAHVSAYGQSD